MEYKTLKMKYGANVTARFLYPVNINSCITFDVYVYVNTVYFCMGANVFHYSTFPIDISERGTDFKKHTIR